MTPTTAEIQADPDRILELYPDGCPQCGKQFLEALTWRGRGLRDVTVGCWACGWMLEPGPANSGRAAAKVDVAIGPKVES